MIRNIFRRFRRLRDGSGHRSSTVTRFYQFCRYVGINLVHRFVSLDGRTACLTVDISDISFPRVGGPVILRSLTRWPRERKKRHKEGNERLGDSLMNCFH